MKILTSVPAGHTGATIYLLNFPAAHTPSRRYAVTMIGASELRHTLERTDKPIVSALGHDGAAQAFHGLVGVEVPMSRLEVSFRPGDVAFCIKLNRRPPEGSILTRGQMEEIGYQIVRVDVLLGDLEVEIADRWVALMRAMGADELRGEVVDGRHRGLHCAPGDSGDLVALGEGGVIGSIRVDTDECPIEATRVSWSAVRDAWVAAGGRCAAPGPWQPRAGETFRGVYDGEVVRGRILTARVAFGELARAMPTDQDPAPALKVDEGNPLSLHGKIERRIVWNLLSQLWDAGFETVAVDDGGEQVKVSKAEHPALAAMEAVFAVDEATLIIKGKKRGSKAHWVKLVGGNGEDIISDWGYSEGDADGFNAFMESFIAVDNF